MCDRDPEAVGDQPAELQGCDDQQRRRHGSSCHQQQIFGLRRKLQICLKLAVLFFIIGQLQIKKIFSTVSMSTFKLPVHGTHSLTPEIIQSTLNIFVL